MQTLQSSSRSVAEGSPFARHIPALDGIRGFAVLGVVCSHVFPGTPHSAPQSAIHLMLTLGANGVDLFFVLSGFLITGILYDSLQDSRYFRKFYARRALRIFPLYYGTIAIFAMAALVFGLNFHRELLSLTLYLQNSSLIASPIRDYHGPSMLPLPHFWSLAIEEQFYLVWPLTVFLLRKKRHILLVCAASMLLCPFLRLDLLLHGMNYFTIQTNTLCRADSLLAGGALSLLLRSRFHDRVLRAGGWIFAAGLLAWAFMASLLYFGRVTLTSKAFPFILTFDFSAIALFSTGLIALALRSWYVRNLFSLKPMRWLGKYSYGIYVLHVILFIYLEEPLRQAIRLNVTANKGFGIAMTGLLVFALSAAAAYLSYNLYERQFLRLKRFFDYRPHPNTIS